MTCPLLYRFRTIDRLPERPSRPQVRGTLVHSVLEGLFDLPAADRTPEAARAMIAPVWDGIIAAEPHLVDLVLGPETNWNHFMAGEPMAAAEAQAVADFLAEAADYVDRYYRLEDPTRLDPDSTELPISIELDSGLVLRGIVDRLDRAPNGALRVVDYKTGRSPGQGWEAKALFQMRFYGLVLWRQLGQVPARLQLIFLGNEEVLRVDPTEAELLATEHKLQALWRAISRARDSGDWRPRKSRLCSWCSFQQLCPAWGGTPPALPRPDILGTNVGRASGPAKEKSDAFAG